MALHGIGCIDLLSGLPMMRKMIPNQVSNKRNALLEIFEVELVAGIPSKMSRGFRCAIVELSQQLFCGVIEGSELNKIAADVGNFHLIREAIVHVIIATLNKLQPSFAINPK